MTNQVNFAFCIQKAAGEQVVVVETHPIKQIIIHAGEGDVKQLASSNPVDVEYEDV